MKWPISLVLLSGLLAPVFVSGGSAGGPFTIARVRQSQHNEIKIDAKLFDDFTGQYVFPENPDQVFSAWREGDKFFLQLNGRSKWQVFPEGETQFFLKVIDAQLIFVRDPQGKVTELIFHQGTRDTHWKKISDRPNVETGTPFERREVMISMRDGVRLHTLVFIPKNISDPLPLLMNRTPYGIREENSDSINSRFHELVKDGYIFVLQDIRGRYDSEGHFLMNRPMRNKSDPNSTDESTDTYDTIDWLLKNVPKNNGRAGILGVSYDGWLAAVATVDAHPALKAASPQAPMTDTYLGDDFFHNGAFRETYGYEYGTAMESTKEDSEISLDKPDAFDWYLGLKSLSQINEKYLHGKLPTWNAFVEHPNYDDYWKARAAERYLAKTNVATLVVGGWWDQEDYYGTLETYKALEKFDTNHSNFIVLGPWNHGGWGGFAKTLGAIDFGSSTGLHYRRDIEAPWFAFYLKDKGTLNEAAAETFQSGTNRWVNYDHWPPKEAVQQNLFLHSGKKLNFDQPARTDAQASESYVSDPANPVPYRKRPIEATYDPKGSGWSTWLVGDQRFLEGRPDVVSWQTDPLTDDLTVSGDIVADIFASTTGSDSDWVVKLVDVYPNDLPNDKKMAGYQLMIVDEIFRGRFRQSFEKPAPTVPNQVNEYVIDLHSNNHVFKKGHRVMVQVQSTWFPLYDRNPQKFVENIFKAVPSDYQSATQHVFESQQYPSHVILPVIK